jgi:signal peptidase II
MPGINRYGNWWRGGLFLLVAVLIVAADQVTKLWIRSHLPVGKSFPEVGCLSIIHVQNTGVAFGLFANQSVFLSIVAVAGIIVVLLFYRYLSAYGILGTLSLGLIFGGAVGNQIDRIRLGYVTDFVLVRLWDDVYWPTFNVADSAITVGTIALACFIFLTMRRSDGKSSESRDKDNPGH